MATVFSIKDPNPGVWFKFDEDDPESGEIKLRAANTAKLDEIDKLSLKRRVEYVKGQRFEVYDKNEDLHSELLWDYVIVEWDKLEDEDQKPIPCNTETKLKLMRENIGFSLFVSNCLNKLKELDKSRVSVLEKNSRPGLKDSGKSQAVKSAKS
jgi:hypothetical protein